MLLGELNDSRKGDLLRGASALLFPIDSPEPFGLVMIEAMACGTPVIAFRRGSVPEVIDQGVSGFIVENEEEAVAAIKRIGELDRRRVRAAFEQRFTAKRMAEDYIRHYKNMLNQRHAYPPQSPCARALGLVSSQRATLNLAGRDLPWLDLAENAGADARGFPRTAPGTAPTRPALTAYPWGAVSLKSVLRFHGQGDGPSPKRTSKVGTSMRPTAAQIGDQVSDCVAYVAVRSCDFCFGHGQSPQALLGRQLMGAESARLGYERGGRGGEEACHGSPTLRCADDIRRGTLALMETLNAKAWL
jgi:Glycosyl transferases group 1